MIGQLFTQYFLSQKAFTATDAWQDCVRQPLTFTAFKQSLRDILDKDCLRPQTQRGTN